MSHFAYLGQSGTKVPDFVLLFLGPINHYQSRSLSKYVTRSVKTLHNCIFFKLWIIIIYLAALAKFQTHISISFGITALETSNNRKINLYSKNKESKYRHLQKQL